MANGTTTEPEITCGSLITHNNQVCLVRRLVDSTTFFEAPDECYLLEEKYAEVITPQGKIEFKYFVQLKHPFQKVNGNPMKGLDPNVWKRF